MQQHWSIRCHDTDLCDAVRRNSTDLSECVRTCLPPGLARKPLTSPPHLHLPTFALILLMAPWSDSRYVSPYPSPLHSRPQKKASLANNFTECVPEIMDARLRFRYPAVEMYRLLATLLSDRLSSSCEQLLLIVCRLIYVVYVPWYDRSRFFRHKRSLDDGAAP